MGEQVGVGDSIWLQASAVFCLHHRVSCTVNGDGMGGIVSLCMCKSVMQAAPDLASTRTIDNVMYPLSVDDGGIVCAPWQTNVPSSC